MSSLQRWTWNEQWMWSDAEIEVSLPPADVPPVLRRVNPIWKRAYHRFQAATAMSTRPPAKVVVDEEYAEELRRRYLPGYTS